MASISSSLSFKPGIRRVVTSNQTFVFVATYLMTQKVKLDGLPVEPGIKPGVEALTGPQEDRAQMLRWDGQKDDAGGGQGLSERDRQAPP